MVQSFDRSLTAQAIQLQNSSTSNSRRLAASNIASNCGRLLLLPRIRVKPRVVAEIEFLECTGADHLRHTKFVGLRDDKDPRAVVRET